MSSTTTKLGLYKPAAGENVNVTTDLNNNWDSIDSQLGPVVIDGWTAFTPTFVNWNNPTDPTVNRARAKIVGKTVKAQITVTAANVLATGTTQITLPATLGSISLTQHASYGGRDFVAGVHATDVSTGVTKISYGYFVAARTLQFRTEGQNDAWSGAGSLPFAVANGDVFSFDIGYELA